MFLLWYAKPIYHTIRPTVWQLPVEGPVHRSIGTSRPNTKFVHNPTNILNGERNLRPSWNFAFAVRLHGDISLDVSLRIRRPFVRGLTIREIVMSALLLWRRLNCVAAAHCCAFVFLLGSFRFGDARTLINGRLLLLLRRRLLFGSLYSLRLGFVTWML